MPHVASGDRVDCKRSRKLDARVKSTKIRLFLFFSRTNYRVACMSLFNPAFAFAAGTHPPFFRSYIRGGVSFFLPASGTHMYSLSHWICNENVLGNSCPLPSLVAAFHLSPRVSISLFLSFLAVRYFFPLKAWTRTLQTKIQFLKITTTFALWSQTGKDEIRKVLRYFSTVTEENFNFSPFLSPSILRKIEYITYYVQELNAVNREKWSEALMSESRDITSSKNSIVQVFPWNLRMHHREIRKCSQTSQRSILDNVIMGTDIDISPSNILYASSSYLNE